VVLRDSTHAVRTDEALDVFRKQSTTTTQAVSTTPTTAVSTSTVVATSTTVTPSSAPPLVEPGIYRYNTMGSEQIDALGGTSHDYPTETTLTVIAGDCGVHVRWDALRERRDEWGLCSTPDGIELSPLGVQYHEFYNQPDEEAVSCDRSVLLVPVAVSGSDGPQQLSCTLAEDPWSPSWEVLDRTTRTVDRRQRRILRAHRGRLVPGTHRPSRGDEFDQGLAHTVAHRRRRVPRAVRPRAHLDHSIAVSRSITRFA
jgi:hypothetical protein